MSEAKFTPGPWECGGEGLEDAVFDASRERVASANCWMHGKLDNARAIANAHLIAAAPSMYEALTNLLRLCENTGDFKNGVCAGVGHPDEGEHWAGIYMDAARDALAKASP